MKVLTLLISLLIVSSCGKANQLAKDISLSLGSTALSGKKFFYYDQADRVKTLEEIHATIKNNYALWDIKKSVINVDGDKVFGDAITLENTIADVEGDFEQAKSNLAYTDRALEIIAKFQDTHFAIMPLNNTPEIDSGIITRLTTDGVIVRKKADAILAYGREEIAPISIGDKVISIDGVDVEKQMQEMMKYVSGSTSDYVKESASYYIATRNFAYPEKNYSDWEFENADGKKYQVRLPWFYKDDGNRADANFYLNKLNFIPITKLNMNFDRKEKKWNKVEEISGYEGFKGTDAPKDLQNIKEWKEKKSKSLAIRTGHIFKKGKVYGYLALFDFSSEEVEREKTEKTYREIVIEFVKELKENDIPLILDIRNNGGGSMTLAGDIASYIAKKDDEYPRVTVAYRITREVRQIFEMYDFSPEFRPIISEDSWAISYDEIAKSLADGREYTYSIADTNKGITVRANEEVEGYEQPVVVLLTENCISACDVFSLTMAKTGRATFLGTKANGTGAGMLSDEGYGSEWKDGYSIFKLNVPNILFGYPVDKTREVIEEENSHLTYNSENRPVKADVEYNYTKQDILEPSVGWIEKAVEEIEKQRTK